MGALEQLKKINARVAPENSIVLRGAVLMAVLTAAVAVLREGVGSSALVVAVLLGIPGGHVFSHVSRHREGFWLKVGLAAGLLVAFAQFLSAAGQVGAGSLADLQIPLAELFLWVQILHSMDVPARRDLLFSLASSLMLIAIAGVLSISLALAPLLLVWAAAFVVSLVLAHRSELDEVPSLTPVDTGGAPPRSVFVRARPAAIATLLVVLLAVATFMVVPAAGQARALAFPSELATVLPVPSAGGLSNPTLGDDDPGRAPGSRSRGRASFGYFGFSDELDTAVRGRPDHTLVMRVRANRPDFWRGQTFDQWDGRRWSLSESFPKSIGGGRPFGIPLTDTDIPPYNRSELVQTFYLAQPGPNLIFAAYRPSQLWFPDRRVFQLSDGTLRAGVQMDADAVYTVESVRHDVTAASLRSAPPLEGEALRRMDRYTQLPPVPARVLRLAREVTAGATNTYDKVTALERWMGENTTYSLDVPPLPAGADAVEHYLFVDRKGFCEQIGTALVVMLRSLGIPARLAAGYTPGERNPFTGLYEVHADDAHAWAEVWFPGTGWQGFDPTAHVPLAGDDPSLRAGAGALAFLNRRLPDIPRATLPVLAVLAVAVGATLVVLRWRRERRRAAARSWAAAFLAEVERAGARRGRPRRPSETAAEYLHVLRASVLPDARLEDVARTVTQDAFSGRRASDEERRVAEHVLQEVAARWPPG